MPAVNLSPLFNAITNQDGNGNPLALGKIATFRAGSTTPYPTYSDITGNTALTNPIILGTDGKVPGELWLEQNIAYRLVLQDVNNVQIATYDNISGVVTSQPAAQLLPSGVILVWSGSIGSIPVGWALCDGQAGRPDLRDRFIVGAGTTYTVNATGGSKDAVPIQHTHTARSIDSGHMHTFTCNRTSKGENATPYMLSDPVLGENFNGTATYNLSTSSANITTTVDSSGQSGTNANLPPYYALCFIFKL